MGLKCYCENYCPTADVFNGTCEAQEGGYCFSHVEVIFDPEQQSFNEYRTYGCLPPYEKGLMSCRGYLTKHARPKNISCCREYDLCNEDLFPQLHYDENSFENIGSEIQHFIIISSIIALAAILVLFCYLYKKKFGVKFKYSKDCGQDSHLFLSSDLKSNSESSCNSSGSGSGLARLVQLTIGKQLQMVCNIGNGRYGEVHLAKWRGEFVAVKVFSTTDEASWLREKEIYQTVLLRHENILGFIAADIRGMSSYTQMLLITDYHDRGSLHDYLKASSIDMSSMFTLCYSIASGLAHLHIEIFGTKGKPAIAHRDIKTKNILVKRNGECCIADFGLAVKYDSQNEELDLGNNPKVGTRRYMAPEVLGDEINISWFDSLKRADVYSLSLVFWEVCRRCEFRTQGSLDYQLPYFEFVPSDPTIDEMHDVVCVKEIRPSIPDFWDTIQSMREVSKVLRECWQADPSARLTALRVKYSLHKIRLSTLERKEKEIV